MKELIKTSFVRSSGVLLLSLLACPHLKAQENVIYDSTATEAPARTTFLIGAQAANNVDYFGQKSEERMPYAALVAGMQTPSGFYLSAMGYKLLNADASLKNQPVSAAGATVGWDIPLSPAFAFDLNYSYTYFPKSSPFLQAANAQNAGAALQWNSWLQSSVSFDYSFGKQEDIFATFTTGKYIPLGAAFSNKATFSITPAFSVTGGTQRFYETYQTEKRTRDSLAGLLDDLGNLGGGLGGIIGGNNQDSNGTQEDTNTTTVETARFDLLSWNMNIPLAYNRASYMIELNTQLSLLGKSVASRSKKLNSFFTLSYYYQF